MRTKESFRKTSNLLGLGLKKVQKQGSNERMQKTTRNVKKYTADVG